MSDSSRRRLRLEKSDKRKEMPRQCFMWSILSALIVAVVCSGGDWGDVRNRLNRARWTNAPVKLIICHLLPRRTRPTETSMPTSGWRWFSCRSLGLCRAQSRKLPGRKGLFSNFSELNMPSRQVEVAVSKYSVKIDSIYECSFD